MGRYVFSDLHGDYRLWKAIQNFLGPDDIGFCLGDCVDRGTRGVEILQEMFADDRFFLLKGNHEDMMALVAKEMFTNPIREDFDWWMGNGGDGTWLALEKMPREEAFALINKIETLPTRLDLVNTKNDKIILTHAGTDPWFNEKELILKGHSSQPYLWDREHLKSKWNPADEWKNVYVVHGHTPVQYLIPKEKDLTAIKYCDGHKIDIDMGTPFSKIACLLNIDTFKVFYIDYQ